MTHLVANLPATAERRPLRRPAGPALERPEISRKRRTARPHLFTYVAGNAIFWALWAAISVSTDHWYWWPVIPLIGWAVVLGVRLWRT